MSAHQDTDHDVDANDAEFIIEDDIVAEIPLDNDDDDDHPMDEDDHDDDDELGDLPTKAPKYTTPVEGDNALTHFLAHTSSVFVVAAHPSQPYAVSGGEDDLGYIWDITDGEVIVKLTGHSDSVTCVGWSFDGEMVATGGMDGRVRIWRRVKGHGGNGSSGQGQESKNTSGKQKEENWRIWEFLTELSGPDEVTSLKWHPKGNVLLTGSKDSTLWLWQLPSGNTMQVFAGHSGAVNCADFTPDGKRIISADDDNNFILWDPRSPTPIFKLDSSDARFDLDGITTINSNPASTLAVVGGAAGGLRVVSLSKGEVIGSLEAGGDHGHKAGESIEAIVFVDLIGMGVGGGSAGVVVTAATDGRACIWDLSTMRLRTTLEHEDAITALLPHPPPQSHLVVSASADHTLKTWDARTGNLIKTHKAHQGPVLGAALGLGGSVIVSAGDDGLCGVWTTEETDPNGILP